MERLGVGLMIAIVAVSGCVSQQVDSIVKVTEVDKGRTHVFNHITDGTKTLLIGNFSIGGKSYPGRLLYDGNRSYVFRPNPDQCIIYETPDKLLFGFLPISVVMSGKYSLNVTVLERDSHGRPVKYRISDQETSEVEFEALDKAYEAGGKTQFSLPAGARCVNEEEVFTIG